jgi:predicted nucleic-acid-binding Zn-ribbon protein
MPVGQNNLNQQEQQNLQRHLQRHLDDGCPVCGQENFSSNRVEILQGSAASDAPSLEAFHMVLVQCDNCLNSLFFPDEVL